MGLSMAEPGLLPPIIQVISDPGIKRDGTRLEGKGYTDGAWVRFRRGLPRKIGGYRALNKTIKGLINTLTAYTYNLITYMHAGSPNLVERFFVDSSLNASVVTDRTPTSGFTADDRNIWTFDTIYKTGDGNQIVAQVAPNSDCICNNDGGELFYGDLLGTAPLAAISLPGTASATGGVLALPPYTVIFGNDGFVGWSVPSDPTDFSGSGAGGTNVASQKIVAGRRLRGGPGASPSALLWSVDSLLRMYFVGSTATFAFDTLSDDMSVLSSKCMIEYDGIYYWISTDRFMMFNGVVRDVPNEMNADFFFDNLNYGARQAVYAFKVPRYGEIWWCFPTGTNTVANHAVILNVREGSWYDTPLPNGGRGAALSPSIYTRPFLSGVQPQNSIADSVAIQAAGTGYAVGNVLTLSGGVYSIPVQLTVDTVGGGGSITAVSISDDGEYTTVPADPVAVTGGAGTGATFNVEWVQPYKMWAHETGRDEIDGLTVNPIQSYFETADIALPTTVGVSRAISVSIVEPDFVQSGDMTVQVVGRANARAPEEYSEPRTIPETAALPEQEIAHFNDQRRELRFRFESNVLGGHYEMGHVLAHVVPGDGRVTS